MLAELMCNMMTGDAPSALGIEVAKGDGRRGGGRDASMTAQGSQAGSVEIAATSEAEASGVHEADTSLGEVAADDLASATAAVYDPANATKLIIIVFFM
jgi:hypothetical protein